MRIQLLWPGPHFVASPDAYASLTLVHGSLMVFVVLTCAPQAGFGTYFLPTQIGANEMAFPKLTRLGFWLTALSVVGMVAAFFCGAETGLTLWLASVAVFCVGAALNALNFAVTTIDLRAKGMTLPRMPVTVWAWFVTAILSLLIFSTLIAACVLLLCDRQVATHFFGSTAASPRVSDRDVAAPLLVLHASASLCRDSSVLRNRHASDRHVRPQARLRPSRRRSRTLCRRPLRLLDLGRARFCRRPESLRAARFLDARNVARHPSIDSSHQLVCARSGTRSRDFRRRCFSRSASFRFSSPAA